MRSAVLAALLLVSALVMPASARDRVAPAAARDRDDEPRTIAITAKRFEFVPSTITLKKGETVKLRVTSEDVTHGLFLRPLKIDTDLTAGETQEITVTPQAAGTFSAICHHFCGAGHGGMKLTVVVE
jgi:cytochrome c oxidase subunit II